MADNVEKTTITRRNAIQVILIGTGSIVLNKVLDRIGLVRDSAIAATFTKDESIYQLPTWFLKNRVQAHTRLTLNFIDSPIFFNVAKEFKKMGASVYTRHIKTGDEGAWWSSAVGAVIPEARERNIALEIIKDAHNEGCKIIVYHRHMEDKYMAEEHPDWVCVNWKGNRLNSSRGHYMCFNSPYAGYFQKRLIELVNMGADGFYLDEIHMPKSGCWCRHCKEKFIKETGYNHPKNINHKDPVWNKLADFNNRTIERTIKKWRDAVHSKNGEVVMLVSGYMWPAMTDRHLSNRLFRVADSMKTEFSLPLRVPEHSIFTVDNTMSPFEKDIKLALGYCMARDAADGRPAHIWVHGVTREAASLYATAGVLTHGCIANIDIGEETIPNKMFNAAFALGNKVSPYIADATPLRWCAIHYSELSRDQYITQSSDEAVKKTIYPVYGAFAVLLRAHLPVGIVTDSQVEDGLLNDYKILFLPDKGGFTDKMRSEVKRFEQQGGIVIEQQSDWIWYDRKKKARAESAFMAMLSSAINSSRIQVIGGTEKMHTTAFANRSSKKIVVLLCNDFSWLQTGERQLEKSTAFIPQPCSGVKCVLHMNTNVKEAVNILNGERLIVRKEDGSISIDIPKFEYMSAVVIDLE